MSNQWGKVETDEERFWSKMQWVYAAPVSAQVIYVEASRRCPQSHGYTEENTMQWKNGRKCRTCHRDRERERYRQSVAR